MAGLGMSGWLALGIGCWIAAFMTIVAVFRTMGDHAGEAPKPPVETLPSVGAVIAETDHMVRLARQRDAAEADADRLANTLSSIRYMPSRYGDIREHRAFCMCSICSVLAEHDKAVQVRG